MDDNQPNYRQIRIPTSRRGSNPVPTRFPPELVPHEALPWQGWRAPSEFPMIPTWGTPRRAFVKRTGRETGKTKEKLLVEDTQNRKRRHTTQTHSRRVDWGFVAIATIATIATITIAIAIAIAPPLHPPGTAATTTIVGTRGQKPHGKPCSAALRVHREHSGLGEGTGWVRRSWRASFRGSSFSRTSI